MSTTSAASLVSLISSQDTLLRAAALALPHTFDRCTYQLGYLRQHVHLCLTCSGEEATSSASGPPSRKGRAHGLCGACSIACHGDHAQIELFPKREFRCDCPTRLLDHPCSLAATAGSTNGVKLEINEFNKYNQNFYDGGRFCRCHAPYDAETERETMVQCLVCEDWFHESCLHLRDRIPPREPASARPPEGDEATNEAGEGGTEAAVPPVGINQEVPTRYWDHPSPSTSTSSQEDPSIPRALIPASAYDAFVCGECVVQPGNEILRRLAGSEGARLVVKRDGGEWEVYPAGWETITLEDHTNGEIGKKRNREEDEDIDDAGERPAKKIKTDESTAVAETNGAGKSTIICSTPTPNADVQRLLERVAKGGSVAPGELEGTGDMFFTPGWRERWCKCSNCSLPVAAKPYLTEEEETYEFPDDPDAGLSLEELGMRALEKLPRDQAINGIQAFQTMSAELSAYLAPFAASGQVVTEEDVQEFFERRREAQGRGNRQL